MVCERAFGAHLRAKTIHYARLPFFAIDHETVTRRREFVIAAAGLWMQHAGSEVLLSTRPNLRRQLAPFLKGVLALNLAISTVYTSAAIGQLGRPERDSLSMAHSLGRTGWPEPLVGSFILVPALLDAYRYLRPQHR